MKAVSTFQHKTEVKEVLPETKNLRRLNAFMRKVEGEGKALKLCKYIFVRLFFQMLSDLSN